jgi:hypothetical protein
MNGSNRISSSKPLNTALVYPTRPEPPVSSEPLAQRHAAVGNKRPPAVTGSADHSPNKRPRAVSPASRWTVAAPTHVVPPPFFEPALDAAAALEPDWSSALFNEPLDHFFPPSVEFDLPDADDVGALGCDTPLELLTTPSGSSKNGTDDAANKAAQPSASTQQNALTPQSAAVTLITTPEVMARVHSSTVAARVIKGRLSLSDLELQSHRDIIIEWHAQEPQKSLSSVIRFLIYLEKLGLDWNTLRGNMNNPRPIDLETHVNTAIRDKKTSRELRSMLNKHYGLRLHGHTSIRPTWKPTWPENLDLIESKKYNKALQRQPKEISNLSVLLGYLESKNILWSVVSKPESNDYQRRPMALELLINFAIENGDIVPSTIRHINKLFNLTLKAPFSGLYKLAEHTLLIDDLPRDVSNKYQKSIGIFLAHLEHLKTCWSEEIKMMAGNNRKSTPRLEKIIDTAIHSRLISLNTRESLNFAFGLELKGQDSYDIPEHLELLEMVPKKLENGEPNNYRQCISNFLSRLERQGTRWSVVCAPSPGGDPRRPMALEALVTQEMAAGAESSTRAALNHEFGLQLRTPTGTVTVSRLRIPNT